MDYFIFESLPNKKIQEEIIRMIE
ncbi:Protein of unknown function [Bacillus cytotoxicus]|uniref:Uncharacterized protein n=1 Tax=Bacillus cytotoxicus TaxID=580165 RepID=A0AAX2CJ50_9BACI|nr:Protein of unknown function [Bacillus cytotoxicus]SCN39598.1 Protein of unknown function [Bacillus cytotoxicus]